jgi:hypothetical protein
LEVVATNLLTGQLDPEIRVDGLKTFVIQAQTPCDHACEWVEPYGWVPETGCPVHDE